MVKNPPANAGDRRRSFDPWVRKIPWSRTWQPTPGVLPGKFHGQRSLSPWGLKESNTAELLGTPRALQEVGQEKAGEREDERRRKKELNLALLKRERLRRGQDVWARRRFHTQSVRGPWCLLPDLDGDVIPVLENLISTITSLKQLQI